MTNYFKSEKMNILVTGALGHIGSGFIRKLNTLKGIGRIYLIDNLTTMRYSTYLIYQKVSHLNLLCQC